MDTTLMPLNSAQFTNSISSIGEWFQPYFNPLLTLGLMFAGITIAIIVVRILMIWIVDMIDNALHGPYTYADEYRPGTKINYARETKNYQAYKNFEKTLRGETEEF